MVSVEKCWATAKESSQWTRAVNTPKQETKMTNQQAEDLWAVALKDCQLSYFSTG